MCNCSKPISQTDCQRLLEYVQDPERRTFIYHIFTESSGISRLEIAYVPKDQNPNEVAKERGFLNADGLPEWFHTNEHPCLYPD
jgi:hypothetical protein